MKEHRCRTYGPHLAMVAAVTAMGMHAGVAAAAKPQCKYHNAQIVVSQSAQIPTTPGFDLCFAAPAVGTLNGTATTCFSFSGGSIPLGGVFGTGDVEFTANYYFDTFITHDGTLHGREYNVFDGAIAVSVIKVVGGTGKFAGATGTLTLMSQWQHYDGVPPNWNNYRVTGLVCEGTP